MFSPKQVKAKGNEREEVPSKKDGLVTNNFEVGSQDDFDVLCNVVSVLQRDYDCATEVSEPTDYEEEEMMKHKLVCYFVMSNGCIEEHNVIFERPHEGMKSHLKPFFIKEKVEDTTINKILVD